MVVMSNGNGAQTLLIDADDTLWENNIYFERAIARFISFLDHREYSPAQVRLVLNDVERESILKHGYGLHSFAHSLGGDVREAFRRPVTPEMHEQIRSFAHQIAEHPVEIIAGVTETLKYLSARHHLILMTKGHPTEQSGKVERSGLKEYFSAVEIVAEKDETDVSIGDLEVRAGVGCHVDGRQQSEVGYQSGPGGRSARSFCTSQQYLDIGARGTD